MSTPCRLPTLTSVQSDRTSVEQALSPNHLFCDVSDGENPNHWVQQWSDSGFRTSEENQALYLSLVTVRRFLAGSEVSLSESDRQRVSQWVATANGEGARPIDRVVLQNLQRLLAHIEGPAQAHAQALVEIVGRFEVVAAASENSDTASNAEAESTGASSGFSLRSVGVDLQNDSLIIDGILDNIGIPVGAFVTERSHLTLRVPLEFNLGPYVGMIRPQAGVFTTRGIPGDGIAANGLGWRAGIDVGLVNPQSSSHQAAGLGFELTGVAEQAGGDTPAPSLRLHFFRQDDLFNFTLGDQRQFELGLQTFLNYQETYFTLTSEGLLPDGMATPFSNTASLWVNSPFRMLGISLRYYPQGAPQIRQNPDPNAAFAEGEAMPRIAAVVAGNMINRNRRRGVPGLVNTSVFLGAFEPLGTEGSRGQFDTVGLGHTIFSALDGWGIFTNARDRSEVLRRGNWAERGIMLAIDGLDLAVDIGLSATAEGDPPAGITTEEFIANPGSVRDFQGRAAQMDLYLRLFEYGLTGLDMTQLLGEDFQAGSLFYVISGGAALALGIPMFFFSAPMSGSSCGETGNLFNCGLGSPGPFFSGEPYAAGPGDISQLERQWMVSSMGVALMGWGASRIIGAITGSGDGSEATTPANEDSEGESNSEPASSPTPPVDVSVQTDGHSQIMVTAQGSF